MIVYKITNLINGKAYIGQTIGSLEERWKDHRWRKNPCKALQRAIQKYGVQNFSIKVLARCNTLDELNYRETYYIKLFNALAPNGYNLTTGGNNRIPCEEVKMRISNSQKGEKNHMFGKKQTEESNLKRSVALSGRKQSIEHKLKRASRKSKTIVCVETSKIYSSIREAAKDFGVSWSLISRIIKKNGRLKKQFSFKYVEK